MELSTEDWKIIQETYKAGTSQPIKITQSRVALVTISIVEDVKVARKKFEDDEKQRRVSG